MPGAPSIRLFLANGWESTNLKKRNQMVRNLAVSMRSIQPFIPSPETFSNTCATPPQLRWIVWQGTHGPPCPRTSDGFRSPGSFAEPRPDRRPAKQFPCRLHINYSQWSTIITWDVSTLDAFPARKTAQTPPTFFAFQLNLQS
jgi:hypothetical protein